MTVIDVTEQDFQEQVIERSRTTPVVVDFWAEWCAPCRALTPVLEKAAAERDGQVVLAKLDTDANQEIARRYGIQGIPAVKAFRNGEVVDEFVGVQPPPAVERFFDRLVPSEADQLVAAGDEAALRRALELQPGRADAALALARMLLDRGEREEALEVLDRVRGDFQAEGLAARLRLEADHPELAPAFEAIDAGDVERGLDLLLEALSDTDGDRDRDAIRQAVVGVLDELGVEHPVAREYRRRLAAALY
jgi:putative thioredoxin